MRSFCGHDCKKEGFGLQKRKVGAGIEPFRTGTIESVILATRPGLSLTTKLNLRYPRVLGNRPSKFGGDQCTEK